MAKPLKFARCHPEKENFFGGKCKLCYDWAHDISAPCPHENRKKDRNGRCSSCMSRYYSFRRKKRIGDKFGTFRTTQERLNIWSEVTPDLLKYFSLKMN